MLNDEARERIRLAALRYPEPRAALLPALHIAQKEAGYVSEDAMRFIAGQLNVPESEVFGTATFYSLIRRSSSGRHVISICHNLPCTLLGAEPLIGHLKSRLGVDEGEVTPDGRFSYQRIECIGRCDGAPAMLVDDDYHGDLTPEKIDGILEKYA
ncbi:MAG: NADH-quinone oxidoreductase subunit NuoE [Nitrospirota bacterium]